MNKLAIAIFASGTGSNAVNLINYFKNHATVEVKVVMCNKSDAVVLEKAKNLGVEAVFMNNSIFEDATLLNEELQKRGIDWIILAGFLRKIPAQLIAVFQDRIINIHPSLLPKYGGKGMYGMHVHQAVVAAGEKKSGISIHLVNEEFDKGRILAQFETALDSNDTAETVAAKIHELEQRYFPQVVEQTLNQTINE
jgi:phosphoribosylglycinamide formyltransferase-1